MSIRPMRPRAFTGGALNITFDGNEVSFNNTQHTNSGIEGGVKFWQNGNVNVVGNYVHDNYGSPGLWMDTDNAGFLVQGNYIRNNGGPGMMYEISVQRSHSGQHVCWQWHCDAAGHPQANSRRVLFTSANREATAGCRLTMPAN